MAGKENSLVYVNPQLAAEWHPTKNGDLRPNDVSANSHKKAWWIGECGHEWDAEIKSRNHGRGCPFCSGRLLLKGFNDLATTNPTYLREWNYSKNTEIDPSEIMAGNHTKVWWKCSNGHEWMASPNHRISKGRGCPYCCHNPRVLKGTNDLKTLHPELLAEWDYDKNDVDPSELTSKSNRRVWWKCFKGHEWNTSVEHRVNGSGCPYCAKGFQTSFPENAIYYYVKKAYPEAIHKYKDLFTKKGMELDIYIPSLRTGIEYDGEAFHKSQRQIKNDDEKAYICSQNGIRLIRIKEKPQVGSNMADVIVPAETGLEHALKELLVWIPDIYDIDLIRDGDDIRNEYLSYITENSLLKMNPDLCKEWNYDRNKTTPDMYSAHSNANVWWKCKLGHEWISSIDGRNRGRGCPYCSNNKVLTGFNDLASKRPNLMKEWHPTKNDNLDPTKILPGSGRKAWWKCEKCGYEWPAEISSRNKGHGCPKCNNSWTRKR